MNLLMEDRAVTIYFEPPLEPDAYEELLQVVDSVTDSHELETTLQHVAPAWGVAEITIDPL